MVENRQAKFFYGYIVVAAAFLIITVMWGATYSFGVFFKPLLEEFGWTRAMTSGAFSLSLVLTGLFSVVAGKLTDRFGPRKVMTVCGVFLGSGYLLASQINTLWQLYLFYGVIVGVGMGGSFVPLASTVARWFVRRRGMMTGLAASGIGMGVLIMPPIASWIIAGYDWRTSYRVVGMVALVLIMSVAQFLRRDPGQVGQLPYGESELAEKSGTQTAEFSLREAVHTRKFWMLGLAVGCFGLGLGTVVAHIVLHAMGMGITAASGAVILAVVGGASIAGRVTVGTASDRIGNKRGLIISFSFISIALFWLLAAGELWMLYLFAALFGFGYGGIAALGSPVVAELFGLSSHGVILGVTMIFVEGASAIGPVVAGHLYDITGSYQSAFFIYAVISVIGLILISLLRLAGEEVGTGGQGGDTGTVTR